ncbi:excinuclease ABC subunit UvrC [Candidatus Peregrinibacteria bacterium]|nr:excinuclease ABC subunit UvrC [Candidatus Peregrinibacteria bacterium]
MMTEKTKLQKVLTDLPKSPGVYKMIDGEGRVIYIGKAKDLSKRVKQYFQKDYQHSTRTRKLMENVQDIETIIVDSDLEAMILEHNLIKQLQPKYNVIMKDDKNYVYIKITKEDFPRIQLVRKIEKDNAKYIGPKTAAHKVKETFKVLKKIFPFRHCGLDIKMIQKNSSNKAKHQVLVTHKVLKYPCLDYYIKRCIAPCIGNCSIEEYREIIKNVENFLEGKSENIVNDLKEKMRRYAKKKEFEKAVKVRDKIKKIEQILETQKVQDTDQTNKDVINYCITQNKAYFNLFQIRDGKLIGQENFILSAQEVEEDQNSEVLSAFLKQYYKLATDIPKEIYLPHSPEGQLEIEKKVSIIIPKIGLKNKLLEMSLNNARIFADRNKPSWKEESLSGENALKELQKILKINKSLKRIECYDISHLSGTDTVGSMIVFQNGAPKNSLYRKFKLKTINNKPDDYKSMEEVLTRRFSRISLNYTHKEYILKKATKKDTKFIESNNKVNLKTTDRAFYVIAKGKEQIGFISVKKYNDKVSELRNLWIKKKARGAKLGYKLIKEAIKKSKLKRVYISCKSKIKDYYLIAGFEEIKKIPEEINKHKEVCYMVYDTYKHKDDESFSQIPDLVIIDGGKGQLAVAEDVFKKLKLEIPHISLAKRLEEIFLPNNPTPILLGHHNEALKLLQRARDEAHRFAISYNQDLRSRTFSKYR